MSELSAVGPEDHIEGAEDAKYTLVEYGDYQCPSCGQAAPIVKQVQKHFGKDLRFVFRNYPLPQHEFAEEAAETAEFAASQGKFWEMHDELFARQREFTDELFPQLAKQVGLDSKALEGVLGDGTFEARVKRDVSSGDAAGVQGTPTFYVNGKQVRGSFAFEALVAAIEGGSRS